MAAPKAVKIISFITLEIILYLSFLYLDIFDSEQYKISAVIKFIGIVGCFCYALFLIEKNGYPLYLNLVRGALLFTVISDVFLLLTNESEKGVFTFCIVQGIYRYYLWLISKQNSKKVNPLRFLYLPNIISGLIVLLIMHLLSMEVNILLVITIFYFVSIVLNVIVAIRVASSTKENFTVIFAVGMVLFLLCDINVGIFNLADFLVIDSDLFKIIYEFSTVGMWLFYLPAQVLLAISLTFKKAKQVKIQEIVL